MNQINTLLRQTEDTYQWINKFLTAVSFEKWNEIPPAIETSVSWQAGHLAISLYYHSVMVIRGHQMDLLQQVPIKMYNQWYNQTLPKESEGKSDPQVLYSHLQAVQRKSLEVISSLTSDELDHPLEPVGPPHPVAKTKFEAIDWNIKHTMYHAGQVGILLRVLDKRYDFGMAPNA